MVAVYVSMDSATFIVNIFDIPVCICDTFSSKVFIRVVLKISSVGKDKKEEEEKK